VGAIELSLRYVIA